MKSKRVPCGRRSSVRAMIELGEVQRRTSCVGVFEGVDDELPKVDSFQFDEGLPKVENFRRDSRSSSVNERTNGELVGEVRRRKSNVGVLGSQSNASAGEFEEDRDDIREDSRMIQNWEDQ